MITARIVQGDDYDQFMLYIPQEAADKAGWSDGDEISMEVVDGKLVLDKVRPMTPEQERLKREHEQFLVELNTALTADQACGINDQGNSSATRAMLEKYGPFTPSAG